MIHTSNLTKAFGEKVLFENVSIKFTAGNCYGLIGANGAGKSTFLKILAGDVEQSSGQIIVEKGKRIAVLRQDQFAFDEFTVLETVLKGYPKLFKVFSKRAALYAKSDLSDEEGIEIGELEMEYGEMDGYTLESDAASMLSELGIKDHDKKTESLSGEKFVQCSSIIRNPEALLLDEPTNQLIIFPHFGLKII